MGTYGNFSEKSLFLEIRGFHQTVTIWYRHLILWKVQLCMMGNCNKPFLKPFAKTQMLLKATWRHGAVSQS